MLADVSDVITRFAKVVCLQAFRWKKPSRNHRSRSVTCVEMTGPACTYFAGH
jgi:hypothetical protein